MKENIFSGLHYNSGLVASGSWDSMDEYDREAIKSLADLVVLRCISLARMEQERFHGMKEGELALCMLNYQEILKQYFGVEE